MGNSQFLTDSEQARLRLYLFGTPQIELDGAPLGALKSVKARGILFYLAITGNAIPRSSLAALMWGETSESAARSNLRKALQQLRKYLNEFLSINRDRVGLAEGAHIWVDVHQFKAAYQESSQGFPKNLAITIDLYRGDFLEGFYIRNAPEFESWWLTQRARLREIVLDALRALADQHANAGELDTAIKLTRRYLELEPWREGAHRRLMDLLARNGQRSAALAQYETCCQILSEELSVEPARETVELYEAIRAGILNSPKIVAAPDTPTQITAPPSPLNISQIQPIQLDPPPLFVGRESEMDQLATYLDRCLAGQSQFVFVSGEPGLGKTALMTAFARQALEKHDKLIVAQGNCSAFSGQGDPYLPFRELLSQLTGDISGLFSSPPLAYEQAQRLLEVAPVTMQQLLEYGSFLVNTLVFRQPLLERARQLSQGNSPWFDGFRAVIDKPIVQEMDLQQSVVFEQFANLLQELTQNYPLLILLDDLQWADQGSLHLLTHLGRRLTGHRVLILGAYRPEEISFHPDGERHPLEPVLNEFKRRWGKVTIDLQTGNDAVSQAFVNALLDSQKNDYGSAFRAQFYKRTQGHPLFTVELLRSMQSRGDLTQDPQRGWVSNEPLNWDHIPARVEAVIAERIDRLEVRLRALLAVASVEGERFTAQVIAQVEGLPERAVLQDFARKLVNKHQLIHESGQIEIQRRYLNRYHFAHALFQEYFYNGLSTGERRLLHAEVAAALEGIYEGQADQIAASLAWHFQKACNYQKAMTYFQIAGDRAIQLSGYEEACSLLANALSALDSLPITQENEKRKLKMHLKLGEVRYLAGQLSESLAAFEKAAELAKRMESPEDFALAALGYENTRWRFNLPSGSSVKLLEEALEIFGDKEGSLQARVLTSLVRARRVIETQEEAYKMTQQAIEMARRVDDPQALYEALYLVIWGDRQPEHSDSRLAALDEMKNLTESMGDLGHLQEVYGYLCLEYLERGDIDNWIYYSDQHDKHIHQLQQPIFLWISLIRKALQLINKGQFEKAEAKVQEAYEYGQVFSIDNIEGIFGFQMFTIRREQGRLKELAPILAAFMAQRSASLTWQPGLALLYCELDHRDEAAAIFYKLAKNDFEVIPEDSMWLTSIGYLSEVCAYLGDKDVAKVLYNLLKPFDGRTLSAGFLEVNFGATSRFLGLLAMTDARWEAAEVHLQAALDLNRRMEAWTWLAHTKYLYAILLLTRPIAMRSPDDQEIAHKILTEVLEATHDFGMTALETKANILIEKGKGV
ncbi:MAG: ATP-binding protein [Anaerolineales bacterium]